MAVSTPYTRQSTFADGDLITDSLFNNEFNALINAFQYQSTGGTTGHQHDGSAQSGGNIYRIGDQDFKNKIEVGTDDNGVQDASNSITFYTEVGGTAVPQIVFADGTVLPATTNDVDLGSTTRKFKDLHLTALKTDTISIGDGSVSSDRLTFGNDSDVNIFFDNATSTLNVQNSTGSFLFEGTGFVANNPATGNSFFSASDVGWAFYKGNAISLYSVNANGIYSAEDITVDNSKKLTVGNNAFQKDLEIYNNSNVSYFTSNFDALEIESPISVKTIVNGTTRIEADTSGVDLTGVVAITGNTNLAGNLSIIGNLSTATGTTTFNTNVVSTGDINLTGGELRFDHAVGDTQTQYSRITHNSNSNNLTLEAGGELSLLSNDSTSSVKIINGSTELANFKLTNVKYSKPVALQSNKLLLGNFDENALSSTFELSADGLNSTLENTASGNIELKTSGYFKFNDGTTDILEFGDGVDTIRSTLLNVNKLAVGADNTNITAINTRNIDGVNRDGRFMVLGPEHGATEGQLSVHSSLNDPDMFIGSGYQDTDVRFFTRDASFGNDLETSLHIMADSSIAMYKWGTNKTTFFKWTDKVRIETTNPTGITINQKNSAQESKIGFESTGLTSKIGNSGTGNLDLEPATSRDITFSGNSGVGVTFKSTNNYLGINTSDPDERFHVNGTSLLNNVQIGTSNAARAVIHGTPSAGMTLDVDNNAWVTFTEGLEEVMRVGSNSKRVGIGVEAPLEKLDVAGNIKVSGTLRVDNEYSLPTVDGTNTQVLTTDGSGNLYWGTGVATGSNTSQWTTSSSDIFYNTGGVTIGSNSAPTQKLDVHGQTSTTGVDLKAIAQEKSGLTATDIFVYDTSKDADGGAWRNRTQGTSWYNEDLNVNYRGATRKFPAVAVILAEDEKITIYDGDDPSLPMWMEFITDSSSQPHRMVRSFDGNNPSVTALNGEVAISSESHGLLILNFITDNYKTYRVIGSGNFQFGGSRIATRNDVINREVDPFNLPGLVSSAINDVAMKALPNAPISADTGLPVPTIAVATNAGVSIIKDNNTVVDITGQAQAVDKVIFTKSGKVACHHNYGSELSIYEIPDADITYLGDVARYFPRTNISATAYPDLNTGSFDGFANTEEDFAIATAAGVCQVNGVEDTDKAMVNYITEDYNTGWMPGNVKLASLMSTVPENAVSTSELVQDGTFDDFGSDVAVNGDFSSFGSDLVSNGDFSNGTTDWSYSQTSNAISVVNGRLRLMEDGGPNSARAFQTLTCVIGRSYKVTFDVYPDTATGSSGKVYILDGTSIVPAQTQGESGSYSSATVGAEMFFTATSTDPRIVLVVNSNLHSGDFADWDNIKVEEINGWIPSQTEEPLQVVNGKLRVEEDGGTFTARAVQTLNCQSGKTYRVTYDVYPDTATSSNAKIYISTDSSTTNQIAVGSGHTTSATGQTVVFKATTNSPRILLTVTPNNVDGAFADWDNIKVEEITHWTMQDITTTNGVPKVFIENNQVKLKGYAFPSHASVRTEVVTEAGKEYRITFNCVTANNAFVIIQNNNFTATLGTWAVNAGVQSITFEATTSSSHIILRSQNANGNASIFDDISVERVVPDRSTHGYGLGGNALNIIGTLKKDLVANDADLCGFKFDTNSNLLQMPNASDIAAPTHNYYWSWWQRGTDCLFGTAEVTEWNPVGGYNPTTGGYYFSYGGAQGDKILRLNAVNPSGLTSTNINLSTTGIDADVDTLKYNHYCCVKKGSDYFLYVNGKLNNASRFVGFSENIQNFTSGRFGFYKSGNGDTGRMALFKMGDTEVTKEQVEKLYRDERELFQEGAKCVLTDTENAHAIDYDEDNNLLHVGVAQSGIGSHTDVFSKLQKVSSTSRPTHHTNTVISVSDGLIAEE